MSAEQRHDDPHPAPGYEKTDAHAGATYRAGLYILATMFAVAALLVPAFRFLVRSEAEGQSPPRSVLRVDALAPAPAFPRLVVSEPLALAQYREKEEEILGGYAWVEKDHGIARMPVAEALRIVGERGALPTFPTAAASPAEGVAGAPVPGGRP